MKHVTLLGSGRTGLLAGKGYYGCLNPVYEAADFLAVPPLPKLSELVERRLPKG